MAVSRKLDSHFPFRPFQKIFNFKLNSHHHHNFSSFSIWQANKKKTNKTNASSIVCVWHKRLNRSYYRVNWMNSIKYFNRNENDIICPKIRYAMGYKIETDWNTIIFTPFASLMWRSFHRCFFPDLIGIDSSIDLWDSSINLCICRSVSSSTVNKLSKYTLFGSTVARLI